MNKSVAAILFAGVLWGLMGIFSRNMSAIGFSAQGTLIMRCGFGAVFFAVFLLIKDKGMFRLAMKDLWCFLCAGIISLLGMSYFYIMLLSTAPMSVSGVLLYTAPAMVTVMAFVVFKEKLSREKLLALVLAFLGCIFVSDLAGERITGRVLALGLLSALCYATYSIFARIAINRGYESLTVNFYSCLFAVAGAVIIWGIKEPLSLMMGSGKNFLWSASMGFFTCFLPYYFYTYGLSRMEAGRASIIVSVEPVVAAVAGVLVYKERMSISVFLGILCVLSAVIILNIKKTDTA